MFLLNSRAPLVTETSFSQSWHPLFQSYGVVLPSSLTRVLPNALVSSTHPPVSVYSTVCTYSHLEAFLGSRGSVTSVLRHGVTSRDKEFRICLELIPTSLHRDIQHPDDLPSCVPPSFKRTYAGTGILTRFPSTTLFSLALGAD